jgi:hypothetical protein
MPDGDVTYTPLSQVKQEISSQNECLEETVSFESRIVFIGRRRKPKRPMDC